MKILSVAGARPNFMKIAPLADAMAASSAFESVLVHTGQHYDAKMSQLFFDELQIPRPDVNLDVGSASHAVQTAEVMLRFEPVLLEHAPDAVLVVGDVNSTIACALVAVKLGVPVIHVEAGLRSFDRSMPEEINRVLTDQISDWLFVSEPSGMENLEQEGIADGRVHLVGNVMIDTLMKHRGRADASDVLERVKVTAGEYGVLTMHRPGNVDRKDDLARVLDGIESVQARIPIVFPVHPRTTKRFEELGFGDRIARMTGLIRVDPLGYLDFLKLMSDAKLILTDSGGIQEEATILGVPCLTLRENTERPITISDGTNELVGGDPERIRDAAERVLSGNWKTPRPHPLWDGRAAERIVDVLAAFKRAPCGD